MGEPLWKPRFPEKFQHLIGEKKEQFGYYVNVSASPIHTGQSYFSQDGNISHPTSSSRTFHASAKKWSLILLHLNLGRLVTYSLLMEWVEQQYNPSEAT